MITLEIGTIVIKIDQEFIGNHYIAIIHNIKIDKNNYRKSTHQHQRQINQIQSTSNSENQLKHIHSESKDDESETKITILYDMLK